MNALRRSVLRRVALPLCAAIVASAAASCSQKGAGTTSTETLATTKNALSAGTQWFPVGPLGALPNLGALLGENGSSAPSTLNATGRSISVAVNPQNGQDIYLGTAGGGLWEASNLTLSTSASGTPSANPWNLVFGGGSPAIVGGVTGPGAIGSVVIDPSSCTTTRCTTLWVGTGEQGIRRETFPGTGLYQLNYETIGSEFPETGYFATQIPGSNTIQNTSIGSIALYTPSGASAKQVYFTVSAANVSSGTDATVFANPPSSGFGVYFYDNNNPTTPLARENVPPGDAVTRDLPGGLTLATDSGGNGVLIAGFYNRGLYRKTLPSGTWCPLDPGAPTVSGCPAASTTLPNAGTVRFDHIALAANGATVYAQFADCSDRWSGNGGGTTAYWCSASVFVSNDAGATWTKGVQSSSCVGGALWSPPGSSFPNPNCLSTYSNYDHGLAVSPLTPNEFYLGGYFTYVSLDKGLTFNTVLNQNHPDVHAVAASPVTWGIASNGAVQPNTGTLHVAYVALDGGLAVNVFDPNNPSANFTLAVPEPPVFSMDRIGVMPCPTGSQCATSLAGGTNDNGTVLYNGGRVWTTLSSADVGDVQFFNSNQAVASWYATSPSLISSSGFNSLPTMPFGSGATDHDATEYAKITAGGSGPDGHGKMMLPPLVRDRNSGNMYYASDRVYQISGSALASNSNAATLNPISPRLLETLGSCTRGPDPNPQGTCPALQVCVEGQCRNYYTDIEKIDAISAVASLNDQVYVGTYSGKFYKQVGGTGGTFVQVTNVPTKRACDAATIGVTATLAGAAQGPTPFDPNALANGNRCAPVTSIDVDPASTASAYVTIGGLNNPGSHVFHYTSNGGGGSGDTWTPMFDGDLASNSNQDIPALAIRADPSSPGHVLLGTEAGLYERTASTPWAAVGSVPQVPVTDVIFDTGLGRTYAATHGRGVYMTVTNPVVEVFAGWMDPSMCAPGTPCIWDLLIYGQGFQPPGLGSGSNNCTVNILDENGNVCAGGSIDAFSGQPVTVLNGGNIGQTVFNESDGKQVIAACFNGNCMGPSGNVPISNCEPDAAHPTRILSAIQVLCPNNNGVTVNVGANCPQLQSPPATTWDPTLTSDPPPSTAPPITSVTLVAALDGMPMEALCSVTIPIYASDTHDQMVDRARAAFQASTACQTAGVNALAPASSLVSGVEPEDYGGPDLLQIVAPNAVGRVLFLSAMLDPSTPGSPGMCQHFQNFPGYATNQLDILDTTFSTGPTGAAGGSVTYSELSPLGRCTITVPTNAGDSASTIAANILAAYKAAYATDSNPACPYSSNPGDLVATSPYVPLAPGTLNSIATTGMDVCINDPGVGVTVGPNGVPLQDATLALAALFATDKLAIGERTVVSESTTGYALVANEGGASTDLDDRVFVGDIVSVAPVVLGDRDTVSGRIKSAGSITLGNSDTIAGSVTSSTSVALPDLSQYFVAFPTTLAAGVEAKPFHSVTVAPGAYQSANVDPRGTLVLSSGTYFFGTFNLGPDGVVSLQDSSGPVIIYVRDWADIDGVFKSTSGSDPKLRFVYEGTGSLWLHAPFSGTVVTPHGELDLTSFDDDDDHDCDGWPTHDHPAFRGSFFGNDVVVHRHVFVTHLPAL